MVSAVPLGSSTLHFDSSTRALVGSKGKQSGVTEDCKLHVILIIDGDEDMSGVHLLNRKSGGSLPCKIDELDR